MSIVRGAMMFPGGVADGVTGGMWPGRVMGEPKTGLVSTSVGGTRVGGGAPHCGPLGPDSMLDGPPVVGGSVVGSV